MRHIKYIKIFLLFYTYIQYIKSFSVHSKNHYKRALQKSHEKSKEEKWRDSFLDHEAIAETSSLTNLLRKITYDHLSDCTPIFLYDKHAQEENLFLELLFKDFQINYIHGKINDNYTVKFSQAKNRTMKSCVAYILILKDVMKSKKVIAAQLDTKVVVVAKSSQWRVFDFLTNEISQSFTNLLVIAKSERNILSEEPPFILYTHKLFIDALGSSQPQVLTSWSKNKFTRNVNLFPKKITDGFAGHRFIVSIAERPPFIIKRERDNNGDYQWEGTEVRLINLLSKMYNFTVDFRDAKDAHIIGSSESVAKQVSEGRANLGASGIYVTQEKINDVGVMQWHSQDCASFISLTSTALPRYRAIMGPFHWSVWLALTMVYLFAILLFAFSDKHTLKPLLKNPEEMENMFWYVFGTFTNCFTFTGAKSWSKADKATTKLLLGFYWLFTIIITACYTGSIIAFVTLPVYPAVVDTVKQLISGRHQIGTLDKGGWPHWFSNSTDPEINRLLKNIDLVPSVELGLKNTTKAFFWPYSFLASRDELDYIVRTRFITTNKRSLLHISKECFVQFNVALIAQKKSIYQTILNPGVMSIVENGFLVKIKDDVEWLTMRSATGKLLAVNTKRGGLKALSVDDRALNLDDTQGMFLLLGIGFLLGGSSLLSEWLGGCFNFCKRKNRRSSDTSTIPSNPRSYNNLTPREKLDSIQYNKSLIINRLGSIIDIKFNYDKTEEESADNISDCITIHKTPHDQQDDSSGPNHSKLECDKRDIRLNKNNQGSNNDDNGDADKDSDYDEKIDRIFGNLFDEEQYQSFNSFTIQEIIDKKYD